MAKYSPMKNLTKLLTVAKTCSIGFHGEVLVVGSSNTSVLTLVPRLLVGSLQIKFANQLPDTMTMSYIPSSYVILFVGGREGWY